MSKNDKRKKRIKKLKRKISAWIAQAQKDMFLQAWSIYIEWMPYNTKNTSLMETLCTPEYKEAFVEVNLKACLKDRRGKKLIRETCYHEVAHILTWEIWELGQDRYSTEDQLAKSCEELTQMIAKIALWKVK